MSEVCYIIQTSYLNRVTFFNFNYLFINILLRSEDSEKQI